MKKISPSAVASVTPPAPDSLVRTYLRAKDENRPHLMAQAFAGNACLEMAVKTDTISFPALSSGLEAITDVLVRKFNQTYENVYTFCLRRPEADAACGSFSCDWLVGMSNKGDRNVRVGCGRYEWNFQTVAPYLVDRLTISIETMQVLPPDSLQSIMGWLTALPYPWITADAVARTAPAEPDLGPVIDYISRV